MTYNRKAYWPAPSVPVILRQGQYPGTRFSNTCAWARVHRRLWRCKNENLSSSYERQSEKAFIKCRKRRATEPTAEVLRKYEEECKAGIS